MKVYVPTDRDRRSSHRIYVTPGSDATFLKGTEPPSDWKGSDGKPVTFTVEFINGVCENVDKKLAEYLIERGLARKSPLIRFGDPYA